MKIVQVTSEAKASPIMTALTSTSADMNIDHGDKSWSSAAAAFSSLSRSPGVAVASADGAAWAGCAAWTGCAAWAAAQRAPANDGRLLNHGRGWRCGIHALLGR